MWNNFNNFKQENSMPLIKSAIKRARQTTKRRERNIAIKKEVKNALRAFIDKPSAESLSAAYSEIDTAHKKNLIKKNTAARRKSNLAKIAKSKGVKLVSKKVTKATPVKKAAVKKAPVEKPAVKKSTAKTAKPKTSAKK